MKPASRIQATIEILDSERLKRVPLDTVVGDYMRARRYIGAKDRSEIAERVYNMTRAHARLGWWINDVGAPDTARNRVLAWLLIGDGCDVRRLKDLFDSTKFAPEELSSDEMAIAEKLAGQKLDDPPRILLIS